MFESFSVQDLAENIAATTIIGGAVIWVARKLRQMHKRVSAIWLFLAGDEHNESLIDRMIKEEFRSRYMLMHARDGVFECDSNGMCTYVNPTLARLYGLEASAMLGRGWLAAVAVADRDRVWTAWQHAVQDQIPYEDTFTLQTGRKVKALAHICYGTDRKKPLYHLGVVWEADKVAHLDSWREQP